MPTIAELLVKVGVDASGVENQTGRVSRSLSRVGAGLSATVTPAVLGLGSAAVSAASDLEESVNAVGTVFGPAADQIRAFGETAERTVGLSTRAFNELVTPVGASLQNVGLSAGEAADASINLAQRAADMASVFNVDVSDALTAIQAGLRGEADPLERFGVGLSAAAVRAHALETGLIDTDRELTNNEKAQARLSLIMQQTDKIAGDFAATSGSVANSERIARAEAENMAASFGQQLIPIKQQLISVARTLLGAFNSLSPGMRQVILVSAGVAAALGPVLLVAGQVIRVSGSLIRTFRLVGKAFLILSRLLLANPFVLVAAAIIALVVVVVKNWDKIVKAITVAWNFIKRVTSAVWDAIVGFLRRVWDSILRFHPFAILFRLIRDNWGKIKRAVSGAVGAVRDFIVGGFNRARRFASRAVARLRDAVVDRFRSLVRFVRGIPGDIVGFFAGLGRRMFNVGRNILNGLIDGIKSIAGGVGDVMGSIAGGITDFWPFSPAREGPLRRFPPELAGRNVGALFAAGLAGAERDVVAAAEGIARQAAMDPAGFGAAATRGLAVPSAGGGVLRVEGTGADSAFATAFLGMIGRGQIRLTVDGREVRVG